MERANAVRGLRIAWSVWWGILCVLLVVLCVRSYWWADILLVREPSSRFVAITSIQGRFIAQNQWMVSSSPGPPPSIFLRHIENDGSALKYQDDDGTSPDGLWFHYLRFSRGSRSEIHAPQWFFALVMGAIAVAPWLRWSNQFSLRTLLIATTLVAVLLGLVVWFGR